LDYQNQMRFNRLMFDYKFFDKLYQQKRMNDKQAEKAFSHLMDRALDLDDDVRNDESRWLVEQIGGHLDRLCCGV